MRAVPCSERIASNVIHVGETGAGHAMKLIHNMICHTIFLATSEGCRLAERLGIPLETAIAVINSGNARSFVSEQRFPDHIISRTFDGRSTTANLAKDLGMAARPGARGRTPRPLRRLGGAISWSGRCSRASASRISRHSISTWSRSCRAVVGSELDRPGTAAFDAVGKAQ